MNLMGGIIFEYPSEIKYGNNVKKNEFCYIVGKEGFF